MFWLHFGRTVDSSRDHVSRSGHVTWELCVRDGGYHAGNIKRTGEPEPVDVIVRGYFLPTVHLAVVLESLHLLGLKPGRDDLEDDLVLAWSMARKGLPCWLTPQDADAETRMVKEELSTAEARSQRGEHYAVRDAFVRQYWSAKWLGRDIAPALVTPHECPVCGWRGAAFAPFKGRSGACCPACGAKERHRIIARFVQEHPELFAGGGRMLHFAPEGCLRRLFGAFPGLQYETADLLAAGVMHTEDIQHLTFPSAVFDVILCSHVLEHVPDDAAAMSEIHRVLKPGGVALIMVPVRPEVPTHEDPSVVSREGRKRSFGQEDHVRWYGMDVRERLAATGFLVEVATMTETLPAAAVLLMGLTSEPLFVCRRGHGPL